MEASAQIRWEGADASAQTRREGWVLKIVDTLVEWKDAEARMNGEIHGGR